MATPRILAPLFASAALLLAPSAFADAPKTQQVTIEIDFDATPEATYESIREQAWQVCKPELGSTYASARNQVRRVCQQQVITDVMEQLENAEVIQLAARTSGNTQ